jgi:hypothetical protein
MIDTIRVKFPTCLTAFQLGGWRCIISRYADGEKVKYVYNPTIGAVTFRFTYLPESYDGTPMLMLEFSLPKLVFGNNYQMLESIEETIKIANKTLAKVKDVPLLDISQGVFIRLDLCYNHRVGDAVDDYIKALSFLDYPHRRTKGHLHEGVEYKSQHKVTKFYNKEFESKKKEAYGILRQEITLLDGKDIQELIGNKRPTLLSLSNELISNALKKELATLNLLNNSIGTRKTSLQKLCEEHGQYAGVYLFGLLMAKMEKSRKQLAKATGIHPRSLDWKLAKIAASGLPFTVTDRDEPLPPLIINL